MSQLSDELQDYLRRAMEPVFRECLRRLLVSGEFVIAADGQFIDPDKVEFKWADPSYRTLGMATVEIKGYSDIGVPQKPTPDIVVLMERDTKA